jgi:hypothetical protein
MKAMMMMICNTSTAADVRRKSLSPRRRMIRWTYEQNISKQLPLLVSTVWSPLPKKDLYAAMFRIIQTNVSVTPGSADTEDSSFNTAFVGSGGPTDGFEHANLTVNPEEAKNGVTENMVKAFTEPVEVLVPILESYTMLSVQVSSPCWIVSPTLWMGDGAFSSKEELMIIVMGLSMKKKVTRKRGRRTGLYMT